MMTLGRIGAVLAMAILVAVTVFGQEELSDHGALELRTLSVKELKQDYLVFERTLLDLHPGLYRYNSEKEISARFAKLKAQMAQPMKEDRFFKLISQFLSSIKCYHTYPNPSSQQKIVKNGLLNRQTYFPFYFRIIDDRMIVTADASSRKLPKGSEILKINGHPIADVFKHLLTATYADGLGTRHHRIRTLELDRYADSGKSIFDQNFPLFFPPVDNNFSIEAIDFVSRKKVLFRAAAVTRTERARIMKERFGDPPGYDAGWEFKVLDNDIAYLKIDHFLSWRLSFDYKTFLSKTFKTIKNQKIENLIIDIRSNGGGDDDVYRDLLRYIATKPFPCKTGTRSYFRSTKVSEDLFPHISSFDPQIIELLKNGIPESLYKKADNGMFEMIDQSAKCEEIKPDADSFSGKTYLMTSSVNASAAFTFPKLVKEYGFATLVGQETGGNRKGFNGGSYLAVVLPNSQFEFDLPLLAYFPSSQEPDSGIAPDSRVSLRWDDVGNNVDRELLTVRRLIKTAKQ